MLKLEELQPGLSLIGLEPSVGHWIYPLMQAGIRLETIAQGKIDWNDFAGRLMYQIQQEGKHQFLRDLARNSLRGLISRVKEGKWCGGTPPYAYEVADDGHLVLGNPAHVAAVKLVFRLRLDGMGYRSIAVRLNKTGTPAPSGKPWSHDAIRLILEREAYTGVVMLGGRRHRIRRSGHRSQAGQTSADERHAGRKRPPADYRPEDVRRRPGHAEEPSQAALA